MLLLLVPGPGARERRDAELCDDCEGWFEGARKPPLPRDEPAWEAYCADAACTWGSDVAFSAIMDCRMERNLGFVVNAVGSGGMELVCPMQSEYVGGSLGR